MKTLLAILITLCTISFSNAQNSIPKKLFDQDFKLGMPEGSLKLEIPGFIPDSGLTYKLPGSEFQLKNNDNFLSESNYNIEFRMPVASAEFNSKMPVMIPDSAANYTLRIKEIPFSNPLNKNRNIKPEGLE